MSTKQTLTERLSSGPPVLLDGAVNTELSRRGLVFDTVDWLRVNLDSPEIIAEIHVDYAKAGAELHIANSFAAGRHVLQHAGLAGEFEVLNRAAVRICRDAVDAAAPHRQWIAGSLSTYAQDHDRNNLPSPEQLEINMRDQANILASAGCDMIALEMLFDVEATLAMVRGAAVCGLPLSLGLVCARRDDGEVVLEGSRDVRRGKPNTPLAEALPRIVEAIPGGITAILSVMHSEIEDTGPAVDVVRRFWDGDMAVYPNSGRYVPPGVWDNGDGCDPLDFAEACEAWLGQGARLLGGCCGIGPEHIRELARRSLGNRPRQDPI